MRPITREFIPVEQSEVDTSSIITSVAHGSKIRLVSYNILAKAFLRIEDFRNSLAACLKWEARRESVLTVLRSFDADILCLQELDEYCTFYKSNMERHGYSSVYIQSSGSRPDGCGIFYRSNKLELVMKETIEYNDLAVKSFQEETSLCADMNNIIHHDTNYINGASRKGLNFKSTKDGGKPISAHALKRDCVGIMAAFRVNSCSQNLVIVANTHIFWNPKFANVKLAQVKYLLSRLTKFNTLVADKFDTKPSVLVCGDFNSIPGSEVYQYLISGSSLNKSVQDGTEDLPLPLNSVYATLRGEPQFTNCTWNFTDTLDYIFFCPEASTKPISYLDLPNLESSDVEDGLPNFNHPSDHLPIGADFIIVEK